MQRLDISSLKGLLGSMQSTLSDGSSKDPVIDFRSVLADDLHKLDLIRKGESRYLVAGSISCGCHMGYTTKRIDHYSIAVPCRNCHALKIGLQRIQRTHLPNDAFSASLENYVFDSAAQEKIILEILSSQKSNHDIPSSLFMYGGAGNGKSTISYILAKNLCLSGYRVKYIHHYHEFQKEKKSWSTNESHLDQLLNNVDVLIFDEFGGLGGRTNYSDWFIYTTIELIGIIYEKYRAGQLSIILTSNMNPMHIFNKLLDKNDMALSRLENIFGNPLHMKGPDRRPKGNQVSKWL
jgi:DNA replication protein DnaC